MVVILVVLTESEFRISLFISQLMAKAIPVRGAKFEKPAFKQAFCFSASGKIVGWRLRLTRPTKTPNRRPGKAKPPPGENHLTYRS